MRIESVSGDIRTVKADMVVVNLFEGAKRPGGASARVDAAIGGAIAAAVRDGDFAGKLGETLSLRPSRGLSSPRVLVVGLGKKEEFSADHARQAVLPVLKAAKRMKLATVASVVHGAGAGGVDPGTAARFCALGAALSAFEYDRYKEEKAHRVARFLFVERDAKAFPSVRAGVSWGARVGEAINWGRALVASPPAELRPDDLARAARGVSRGVGPAAARKVRVRVLGLPELSALKAGGILAVAKGSPAPPRLILAEYRGGSPGAAWTALVGKGVTFDTGGLSLKKWEGMEKMKYDMAGGAAMLATIRAAAALGVRRNLVAVVPSVENMPSGTAYRPGDVLRMMSGKTVEILSTDAEGRLILADAIAYAQRYSPDVVIDLATLTGACVVALGHVAAGMMGTSDPQMARLKHAGERTNERVWELPLFEEYERLIRSDVADVRNVGGRWAGAITGALFLKKFAGSKPWIHLDIAGPAMIEEASEYTPRGGSGYGVRLLTDYLSRWKKQ